WFTADEARQLPKPASQSVTRQLAIATRQFERQFAAFDLHRRLGKHTALSGGEDVGDPHGGAKDTGAIENPCCRRLAQSRREFLFAQARMTKIDRQSEVRAARMVDGNEGTVRDDIHRLLAAIIQI